MIQTLEIVHPITTATEDAAAQAIRNAGRRLHATPDDIDLVLTVLLQEPLS